jgi:hypothetical protein
MSVRLFAALVLVCLFAPAVRAQEEAASKEKPGLPVKRVVMFSSGVAYYERQGKVNGDATLDLKFNVRDINDLLKSMVLRDLDGGRISTISYESKKPIEKTLQTFSIDLTKNPSIADLLDQVRGEKVELDAPTKIVGTILGVEHRDSPTKKDGEVIKIAYVNLLTDDGLRRVSLEGVGRIKLLNPKLDAELRQALLVLAANKSVDKKSVTLNFLGAGDRNVRVGYVQESPVWKTSYRLVLADDEKPLMQGWAIVENTTEDDWEGVQLSLISGRPISFLMDLYQPLFVTRPKVELELYSSLRPRTYDQDLESKDAEFRAAATAAPGAPPPPAEKAAMRDSLAKKRERQSGVFGGNVNGERAELLAEADEAATRGFKPGDSVQSVAQASDVGEMFQYTIATPVKLGRQQSAMLPIVNESVEGEKVSIYNQNVHHKHPLNGLRLKNTTDLHLMQGPVTVFDDGSYAGDAKIADLPPKSERLISYAMDLDTEVAPSDVGGPTQLVGAKLVRGTLFTTRRYQREHHYVVKNGGKKAKKVLIEYPIDTNWTLNTPKEASEKTRDLYRFAVTAEPGKPTTEKVIETRVAEENYVVTNLDDNTIAFYVNAKEVSQKIKDALTEIIKRKAQLGKVAGELNELNRQIEVIFAEQGRVRQNMTQVPKDSELFRRYLTKFGEQENQVEKLREQVQKKIAERDDAQKKLNDYLQSLELT